MATDAAHERRPPAGPTGQPGKMGMPSRVAVRRHATIEQALDHAESIVAEQGAGAVSVSEIARRMGMRPPSLYKYFPSLHAIYDGLFERGNRRIAEFIDDTVSGAQPGLDRLLTASRAVLHWSIAHTGLAPLLYWRPVPGFQPSAASFQPSQAMWARFRADLAIAAGNGQLAPEADSDDALRLLTIQIAGISSQQLANEPDTTFADGAFTALTENALTMFVHHYAPSTT